MTAFKFDRRAVLAMGGAFMMSGAHRVMAADGDFPARLAEMQRDGRVSGLHTLLVSRGGKLLFEHYGAGDDQSWGKPLGGRDLRADRAARPAFGDQKHRRNALRYCTCGR